MRFIILSVAVAIFFFSCNTIEKKDKDDDPLTEAEVKDFISQYDAMWARRGLIPTFSEGEGHQHTALAFGRFYFL